MSCGCNKAKSVQTAGSTKKVDNSAVQKKLANLPLIATPKKITQPVQSKISTRQK